MSRNKIKKKFNKRDFKQAMVTGVFLSPSLIGVLLFFIVPFLVVIYFSFIENTVTYNWVGLANYKKLAGNDAFNLAVKNTVRFTLMSVPAAVIIGLILALVLDVDIPGRSYLRSAFLTPLMVPIASVVLIFRVLFDYNGVVNNFIVAHGGVQTDFLKSQYGLWVITIMYLWKNLGYNMILFLSALGNVPDDVIESANLDGASKLRIFFSIKMIYLSPMLVFTTLLSMINSFKIFREIYLMTGEYPYESLYLLQHYMNNTFASADYQKLSTGAIYMSLVVVVIVGLMMLVENHFGKDIEE